MAEDTNLAITFRIVKIMPLSFSIEDEPENNDKADKIFSFTVALAVAINQPAKSLQVLVDVKVFRPAHPDNILSKMQTAYMYQIDNFDALHWTDHSHIPQKLIEALFGISISTTRGVFYAAVKGTYLEDAVMPLFDISQFVPESADSSPVDRGGR